MKTAAKNILDTFRRMNAMAFSALRSMRFSMFILGLSALAAGALYVGMANDSTDPSLQSREVHQTQSSPDMLPPAPPNEKGENDSMSNTIPGASASNSTNTTVQADDSGTTVTVNGQTQTLPPNQSFQQSYETSDNNTTSHTDISVDNSTVQSGRSVDLHINSSTHSSSTTSNP